MRFEESFLADITERVPISQLIGQRVTFDRKKTNAARGDYWFCCVMHGEKNASAHCDDRKGIWRCFGCGAGGGHFKFLMDVDGVTFPRAVEIVADMAGLRLPGSGEPTAEERAERDRRARQREAQAAKQRQQEDRDKARRVKTAGAIWRETIPLAGTFGAAYFEWRGLPVPTDENLRFHPALEHPDTKQEHPAVIARVQGPDGKGAGIWRIYLAPKGEGKLQGMVNAKLGMGPVSGGAVRLGGMAKHIGLAEGVETALAVRALGHTIPVWAGLSTSGIIGFIIPEGVERVTVFPDRDASKIRTRDDGKGIKRSPGLSAYEGFVERNQGRDIRLAPGPERDDYLELYQKTKGVPVR